MIQSHLFFIVVDDAAEGESEQVAEFESKYHIPDVQSGQNGAVHGVNDFRIDFSDK